MNYDKNTLVINHMELAKSIAVREWRTATHVLKLDDLISLANEGLVLAAERWLPYCAEKGYDPEAVQYFKAFASFRIRGNIRDRIRKEDWATRTLRSKSKKLKEAGQDEGYSVEELAERTGMSVPEINKVNARLAARPISLDAHLLTMNDSDNISSKETYLKDEIDTESQAFTRDMAKVFVETVKTLPHETQLVLALRYYSGEDFAGISYKLGIPESNVLEYHLQGVRAVKDSLTFAAMEME